MVVVGPEGKELGGLVLEAEGNLKHYTWQGRSVLRGVRASCFPRTQTLTATPPYRVLVPSCGCEGSSKGSIGQTFPGIEREALAPRRGMFPSSSQLDHINAWDGKFLWFGWYIFSKSGLGWLGSSRCWP